jgi:hypothetical protein
LIESRDFYEQAKRKDRGHGFLLSVIFHEPFYDNFMWPRGLV